MTHAIIQHEADGEILKKYEYDLVEKIMLYLDEYSKTWSDEAYSLFLKTFNEYLEVLKPIAYIPNIASKLSMQTIIPLWSTRFDRDVLETLLISSIEIKRNIERYDHLVETRENLIKLMSFLGIENPDELVMECKNSSMERECLVYVLVLTIVLATNP
ncbi:MAG: hypothetical protein QXS24_06365 [Desulfurococcaceae archaeon]